MTVEKANRAILTAMIGKVRHVLCGRNFQSCARIHLLSNYFLHPQCGKHVAIRHQLLKPCVIILFSDLSSQNPGTNPAFSATRSEGICESSVL